MLSNWWMGSRRIVTKTVEGPSRDLEKTYTIQPSFLII
jgi:hypothetical protein